MTAYGSLLTAGYDGENLRAWKQDSAGNRTYFVGPLELNSQGQVTAVNTFGPTGLLSRRTAAGSVFYTFDPHGSVAQRTDGNGTVLSSSVFDAFGNKLSGEVQTDPWGYSAQAGYFTDVETGLILCTHRYYDPSQGRWLNRDPIGYAGGMNLYGYVGNEPVTRLDPSGHFVMLVVGLVIIDVIIDLIDAESPAGPVPDNFEYDGSPVDQVILAPIAAAAATAPSLPPQHVVPRTRGVEISHNFCTLRPNEPGGARNEHAPAHRHVDGNGPETRIGFHGTPLEGDPELSRVQKQVIQSNKRKIYKACKQIERYIRFMTMEL